ncbi:MAG: hypothetical protein Q4G67_04145, partial [Actinomycetia bacterium]|nr:hypothetical protein [Actinomycetes bacterium]
MIAIDAISISPRSEDACGATELSNLLAAGGGTARTTASADRYAGAGTSPRLRTVKWWIWAVEPTTLPSVRAD